MKGTYIYTTDGGVDVKVTLDDAKATAGGFSIPEADNESPVIPGFTRRMRGVYAEGASGQNIFFPMATQDKAQYAANSSVTISYKGANYQTLSRRGERIYYGSDVVPTAA